MSRSKKDGPHRGGHIDKTCRELWSRRCMKVNMCSPDRWSKTFTHRHERRVQAKRIIREELAA